jgi:hypothetical protein
MASRPNMPFRAIIALFGTPHEERTGPAPGLPRGADAATGARRASGGG